MDGDEPLQDLLFFPRPVTVVVRRVEFASAQVMTALDGPLLEAFGDLGPRTFQFLGQLLLGARAKNGQSLHRFTLIVFPDIVAKCVHQRLDLLCSEVPLDESFTFSFVVIPFSLPENMRLDLIIKLNYGLGALLFSFRFLLCASFSF